MQTYDIRPMDDSSSSSLLVKKSKRSSLPLIRRSRASSFPGATTTIAKPGQLLHADDDANSCSSATKHQRLFFSRSFHEPFSSSDATTVSSLKQRRLETVSVMDKVQQVLSETYQDMLTLDQQEVSAAAAPQHEQKQDDDESFDSPPAPVLLQESSSTGGGMNAYFQSLALEKGLSCPSLLVLESDHHAITHNRSSSDDVNLLKSLLSSPRRKEGRKMAAPAVPSSVSSSNGNNRPCRWGTGCDSPLSLKKTLQNHHYPTTSSKTITTLKRMDTPPSLPPSLPPRRPMRSDSSSEQQRKRR